jgi:hypothetical protein
MGGALHCKVKILTRKEKITTYKKMQNAVLRLTPTSHSSGKDGREGSAREWSRKGPYPGSGGKRGPGAMIIETRMSANRTLRKTKTKKK